MKQQYRDGPFAAVLLFVVVQPAFLLAQPDHYLCYITVGMPVAEIPNSGYVNLTCANDTGRKLRAWSAWRECPSVTGATHALRFDFGRDTSREGTVVAG